MNDLTPCLLISTPSHEMTLTSGWMRVEGYLPFPVQHVEVSADGGLTWHSVEAIQQPSPWAWGYWEACLYLPEGGHILMARAYNAEETLEQAQQEICIYCV